MSQQTPEVPPIGNIYAEQAKPYSAFAMQSFSWIYLEQPAIERRLGALYRGDIDILDAGCGSGRIMHHLISKGASPTRLTGLDLSQEMLDEAKKDLPDSSLLKANLMDDSFLKERFDLITCSMVLHYFNQEGFETVMNNFYRWLKKDGVLFYIESHPTRMTHEDLTQYFNRRWMLTETPWQTQIPYFHRTISDYVNTTIKAGFKIEEVDEPEVLPEGRVDQKWYEIYTRFPSRLAIRASK